MISQQYTRNLIITEFATNVMNEASALMLGEQLKIADSFYERREGNLQSNLSATQTKSVSKKGENVYLTLDYVKYIRFLDLSKTSKGKKKKVYTEIYNRFFFGYIYGYAYKRLRYGLSQGVRNDIINRLKQSGYTID